MFDYVYPRTGDRPYLELFKKIGLRDRLIYVDQERIDYQKEENSGKLLPEIYGQEKSNPYPRTLNYIAVLEGLTKRRALVADVPRGAVTYALGRGTDYEFVDISKIRGGIG